MTKIIFVLCILCFIPIGEAFESYDSSTDIVFVEQVITNDEGVCLLIDESWLIADGLQASSEGMFVSIHGAWMPLAEAIGIGDYQASWECRKCGRFSMDGVSVCPYCGTRKNG